MAASCRTPRSRSSSGRSATGRCATALPGRRPVRLGRDGADPQPARSGPGAARRGAARQVRRPGTRRPSTASTRRPDGALRGVDPGPAGSALAGPAHVGRESSGTPRREVAPCASHSCPWPRSPSCVGGLRLASAVERRLRPSHPTRNTTSRHRHRTRCAGLHAVRRRDVRGSRHEPDHRYRRGPRLDLRHGRRHRLVHASPSATSPTATRPTPASVRVEEWVNAFDQGYARARRQSTFAVHVDGAPTPFIDQRRGPAPDRDQGPRVVRAASRPDAALTFVIDTSGSMAPRGSPRARQGFAARCSCAPSGAAIRSRSSPSASDAASCCRRRQATDERTILAAIDELEPGGSTNLEAGPPPGLRRWPARRSSATASTGSCSPPTASPTSALTDADGILRQIRGRRRAPASSSSRSASGWATTTTPCSSSWPTRATASTPTSTTSPRRAGCSPRTSTGTLQIGRPRRQGPGRVRSGGRRRVPAHRLREPGDRRRRLPRSARRRRRDRRRPLGDRAVRA